MRSEYQFVIGRINTIFIDAALYRAAESKYSNQRNLELFSENTPGDNRRSASYEAASVTGCESSQEIRAIILGEPLTKHKIALSRYEI